MLRYHKQVFFDLKDQERLKTFTHRLNGLFWKYNSHCLDHVRYRAIDVEGLLLYIKDVKLDYESIFEYYADEKSRDIIKVCYRINWYNNMDIILVLNQEKSIITIYLNSAEDKHETLKREAYIHEL